MNKQTLKALRGSIKKWELIVSGDGVDNGVENCPLCTRFYNRDCAGCPVMEKTGFDSCLGSPYEEWLTDHIGYDHPHVANTNTRRKLARAELTFLKRLLP